MSNKITRGATKNGFFTGVLKVDGVPTYYYRVVKTTSRLGSDKYSAVRMSDKHTCVASADSLGALKQKIGSLYA